MTTENDQTLMTDATQTNEGDAASQQAQAAATGAVGESQKTQTDAASNQAQAGEQKPPAESNPENKTDAKDANKPEGAPEKYDFQSPEGTTLDETVLASFSDVAKELDLPQDKAQKVLDKMAPVLVARQAEQIAHVRNEWADTSRADKEFGGEKLAENLATAKKAMDAFATPELRELLNESGLGNHPEVIRLFYRTGKAMSEDRFVTGQAGGAKQKDARSLYAASNMNP